MRILLFFFYLILFSGCSFKTIIHPYPLQYDGNPEKAIDRFEIQRINDYELVDPDTSIRLPLSYDDGSLLIMKSIIKEPVWIKKDSFINPISKQKNTVSAIAKYNPEFNADEFTITLSQFGSDPTLATIEGLVEDATVFMGENSFRFAAQDFWEAEIKKERSKDGTKWHHYPYGGTWNLSINNVMVGEIVQGSPVVKGIKIKTNYGVSYSFLLLENIDESLKSELINAMLAYLALVDMEYYYYECDPDYPENGACPGSIVIR